jgi:hypothetical protein
LTDRTAKVLGEIQRSDWPPALAASCARSIVRMNERAQQNIVKREGRLGWRLSALSAQAIHFAGLFLTLKLMGAVAYLVKRPVFGVSLIVVASFGTAWLIMHRL